MRPSSGKHQLWWGNFYAAQTFDNAPQGRRIQIGWGQNIVFPDMPFNQQMTVPCELTLRRTDEGVRMFAEPVKELDALHGRKHAWRELSLGSAAAALKTVRDELLDIRAELDVAKADSLGLAIRGVPVRYDAKAQQVVCEKVSAPLAPVGGRVKLRILADRGSIEVFGNSGRVAMSIGVLPQQGKPPLEAVGKGDGRFLSLEVDEVRSAWVSPAGE
jgi:fructan beta-fructosidase